MSVSLLTEAVRHGLPRIVLAGSLEEPQSYDDAPASPYAAAKHAQQAYARMFQVLYGLSIVTARLFMVYGPNQKDTSKLLPYVIQSMLRGETPVLTSGEREVDWVYVEDVVEALVRIGTTNGIEGRTIDIGSGALTSVRAVAELLAEIVDPAQRPAFGALPDRPFERTRVADTREAERLTGWRARTPLREGLERTVAWYRR
jgi:nucleoside-diphosphate-sugar epimerase